MFDSCDALKNTGYKTILEPSPNNLNLWGKWFLNLHQGSYDQVFKSQYSMKVEFEHMVRGHCLGRCEVTW